MELKVGMYVRLDRCQGIAKIDEYDDDIKRFKLDKVIYDEYVEETFVLDESDIIKASESIIDLIEVGDYVNGKKVDKISFIYGEYYIKTKVSNTGNYDYLPEHLIEDIVTKEQFESIKYEVE